MCPTDATNCEDNELLAFPPSPSYCKHSQAGSWGGATPLGFARPASSLSAQEQVLLRASRSRAQQLPQGGIAEESPNSTPIAWFSAHRLVLTVAPEFLLGNSGKLPSHVWGRRNPSHPDSLQGPVRPGVLGLVPYAPSSMN